MNNIFLSSSCIDSVSIIDAVNTLKHISRNIELSGGTKYQPANIAELNKLKIEQGFSFLLHNYFPPPETAFVLNFADTSDFTRQFICNSMQYVQELEMPHYSIHAGFHKTFSTANELLINGVGAFNVGGIGKNIARFTNRFPDSRLAIENLYPNNNNLKSCFGTTVTEIDQIMGYDDKVSLLFDLGHLKISAAYLGFDFDEAVDLLFLKYHDRIIELHLSENSSEYDEHEIITESSAQYKILKRHVNAIKKNNIYLTIEARGSNLEKLKISHDLVRSLFGEAR